MHIKTLESWWDATTDNAAKNVKKTGNTMEAVTKESMDWLDKNFDKLKDESKKSFNKFKDELSNS
jgi:gas vesicle protein